MVPYKTSPFMGCPYAENPYMTMAYVHVMYGPIHDFFTRESVPKSIAIVSLYKEGTLKIS